MSADHLAHRYTEKEYLALEETCEDRHEYLDGEILAMAGESGEHADISVNLVALIANQLRGGPCRVRTKDTKVRSGTFPRLENGTRGLYSYPDLVVICSDPKYDDDHPNVLLNPTVIFEVLSPSTEAFDRGQKFTRYQDWNPSLSDYVLVSQHQPQIELFSRQASGGWTYKRYAGLNASLTIPSVNCTLRLADVYERIDFAEELTAE